MRSQRITTSNALVALWSTQELRWRTLTMMTLMAMMMMVAGGRERSKKLMTSRRYVAFWLTSTQALASNITRPTS